MVVPTTIQPPSRLGGTVFIAAPGSSQAFQVTLSGVTDPAAGADQFAVPVAGGRFVGIRLQITSKGTSAVQEDFATDTSIEDSQGSSYANTVANLQNCPAFAPGLTLSPGKGATGCVTFEVSTGTRVTDVTFTPGGQFGGVSAEWDLS